jgi:uncharacterized OsmC-like protein
MARPIVRTSEQHNEIVVDYDKNDRFTIAIQGHVVVVDQPTGDAGAADGPTPTQLFVGSLVSCMAFYAQRFLRRNACDTSRLRVSATYSMAERPNRVGSVHVTLAGVDFPDGLREPLHRVMSHCTVHNTLTQPPTMKLTIA